VRCVSGCKDAITKEFAFGFEQGLTECLLLTAKR